MALGERLTECGRSRPLKLQYIKGKEEGAWQALQAVAGGAGSVEREGGDRREIGGEERREGAAAGGA